MHLLRLFLGSGTTGSDRPDRLVGDHGIGEALRPDKLQHRGQLAGDDRLGLPGLALLKGFTDAQHRHQAGMQGGSELARDQLTALVVVLAALGVADQAVAGTDLVQHGRAHLAGVGALLVAADVLCTKGQASPAEVFDQLTQVGHRRQDHHLHPALRQPGSDLPQQFGGELTATVQLPVSSDDLAAHERVAPV
ncbi:hypothetical protein D3C73_1197670 [compost metagenome]